MDKGTVIVVGAGPGLGLAIANAFAERGYPIALIARNKERLAKLTEQLTNIAPKVGMYSADAGDPDELKVALQQAVNELGEPEVVVYNAAVLAPDKPIELDTEEFTSRLAVDMGGAKVAASTVLPLLRGGHGTLLFTGGGLSLNPSPDFTSLSVGKAALRAYVLALFQDLREKGVHAATITIFGSIGEPGFEPDKIAESYVRLHLQQPSEWASEIQIK
jgi:short-subunit dehydrogenase